MRNLMPVLSVLVLTVVLTAGCAGVLRYLFENNPATGEPDAAPAFRGLSESVPVTWGEGIMGGYLLAREGYSVYRRFRPAKSPTA